MPRINPLKAKIIAKRFIDNKLNMVKTIKEIAPTKTDNGDYIKANRYLKNPEINQAIIDLLDQANITPKDIADMIADLKDAKTITQYKGDAKQTDLPDNNIKIRLLDIILNRMISKDNTSITNNTYIQEYNNNNNLQDILKDIDNKIKDIT